MNVNNKQSLFLFELTLLFLLAGCGGGGGGGTDATESLAPEVVNNTGSVAGEGVNDTILQSELSFRVPHQSAGSVKYVLISGPDNGQMENSSNPGIPVRHFTQAEINAGQIIYKSVSVSAVSDYFTYYVDGGNGNRSSEYRFVIDVIPKIDSLKIDLLDGAVHLSWINPVNRGFLGVEIRRRIDGNYPVSHDDGILVYKSQPGDVQALDEVFPDPGEDLQTFNYTAFSFGAGDVYSSGARAGLYCETGRCVTVPDLGKLNRIHDPGDVENLRKQLIAHVWGMEGLPSGMPASVTNITDGRFNNLENIKFIVVGLPYGFSSKMRLYEPTNKNDCLMIYHEGHRGPTDNDLSNIQHLIDEGFYVLQLSMPLVGLNGPPVEPYLTHDDLAVLDLPMRFFLEPVTVGLNYIESGYDFDIIYMMGISGGGWTTVAYSALDPRIDASYPVAGSYPFYLRNQLGGTNVGDFEQVNPDFYQNISYIELYLMGAAGRRQLQVFNQYDDCCFEGTYSNTYKDYVRESAAVLGGSFDSIIDNAATQHIISDYALGRILNDIGSY